MDIPDQLIPISPAYEERFPLSRLSLLRAPRSRVVYVTSQPIHPRVADYYFSLVPELDTPEARSRFETVSLVDGRKEPLSRKLLTRPGAVERVRRLIGEPEVAMIIPFCMTADEVGLAEGAPAPDLRLRSGLNVLGSKTGSRRLFADEGVQHPVGLDVRGRGDLAEALAEIRGAARRDVGRAQARSRCQRARERAARSRRRERDLEAAIELEDEEIDVEQYLALLDEQGGIVEERIEGDDFRSPSVQLRMSPAGQVDIMSTHDQVLGGANGQTYFGCQFPPIRTTRRRSPRRPQGGAQARPRGRHRPRRSGLRGVQRDGRWSLRTRDQPSLRRDDASAVRPDEPHGRRLPASRGEWRTRNGAVKHYVATDHLDLGAYRSLTPDDLLDVVQEKGLGWDGEREVGVVLHLVSAIAVAVVSASPRSATRSTRRGSATTESRPPSTSPPRSGSVRTTRAASVTPCTDRSRARPTRRFDTGSARGTRGL
jgi:hypothetical protein